MQQQQTQRKTKPPPKKEIKKDNPYKQLPKRTISTHSKQQLRNPLLNSSLKGTLEVPVCKLMQIRGLASKKSRKILGVKEELPVVHHLEQLQNATAQPLRQPHLPRTIDKRLIVDVHDFNALPEGLAAKVHDVLAAEGRGREKQLLAGVTVEVPRNRRNCLADVADHADRRICGIGLRHPVELALLDHVLASVEILHEQRQAHNASVHAGLLDKLLDLTELAAELEVGVRLRMRNTHHNEILDSARLKILQVLPSPVDAVLHGGSNENGEIAARCRGLEVLTVRDLAKFDIGAINVPGFL